MTTLPGPELDDAVAVAIGWDGQPLAWSTNAGAALTLLDHELVKVWTVEGVATGVRCSVLLGRGMARVDAHTFAHAIALAVVKAHENRVQRGCCGDD